MCVRENTLCTEAPVLLYIFWCSYACITYIYIEREMFVVFTFTEDVIIATQNCIYSLLLHIPAYRPTVFFQVWCIYFTPEIFVCVWKGVGRLQKNWWDRVCVSVKAKELKKIDCKFPSVKRKAVVFSNFWPCCISYVCISYLSARFTLAEGVWNDKFLVAALCLVRQCKLDTKMFTHSLVFPFFSNDTNVIALESRVKLSIMSLCSELFSVFCVCVCCLFFAGACDSAY